MPVRLKTEDDNKVKYARDMQDGEIGVIVAHKWPRYIGIVVQRFASTLVSLGRDSGHSWGGVEQLSADFNVRVLEPGETIEVTE